MLEDLRTLRAFVIVAEELNFRRAAERLHMSQPPLSRMISALEETAGVRFFVRDTRHVELTTEGRLFLKIAQELLEAAAHAGRKLRHGLARTSRTLHIGATSTAYFTGFGALVSRYRKRHPDAALEIHDMSSDEQLAALAAGGLDVAFILPAMLPKGIVSQPFATVRMRLAVSDAHPLATRRKPVPLESFEDEIFILHERSQDPGMYEGILSCCERAGFRPRVRVKRRSENCMGLVTTGAGIHFSAATSGCVQTAGVKMLSLQGEAPRLEIVIAWRRDDPSPVLGSFLETASARP